MEPYFSKKNKNNFSYVFFLTQRYKKPHTHIHTCQNNQLTQPQTYVSGRWEEPGEPGGNSRTHGDNMQTQKGLK